MICSFNFKVKKSKPKINFVIDYVGVDTTKSKKNCFSNYIALILFKTMFNQLNTYRHFLFGLLFAAYVFSVFHKPIFEALHLMCHLPGIVFSDEKIHSFQSHDDQVHQHESLVQLEKSTNENEDQSQVPIEKETKKKVELMDVNALNLFLAGSSFENNYKTILPFKSAFKIILSPPPQQFS